MKGTFDWKVLTNATEVDIVDPPAPPTLTNTLSSESRIKSGHIDDRGRLSGSMMFAYDGGRSQ